MQPDDQALALGIVEKLLSRTDIIQRKPQFIQALAVTLVQALTNSSSLMYQPQQRSTNHRNPGTHFYTSRSVFLEICLLLPKEIKSK